MRIEVKLTLVCFLTAGILFAFPRTSRSAPLAGASSSPVAPGAANVASEGECKIVFDSGEKVFSLPHHVYSTSTNQSIHGGQPQAGESILTDGARYLLYKGKWQKSPLNLEESRKLTQETRKETKVLSCHYLRAEPAGGDLADVYNMRTEHEGAISDMTVWISRSRGVYLRVEADIDVGGDGKNKTHISSRYEYTNVHAPQL